MTFSALKDECSFIVSPGTFSLGLAVFITFGIFLSYVPQYIKVYLRRSSEGISPFFLFLGIESSLFSFLNILLSSQETFDCCRTISGKLCAIGLIPLAQIGLTFVSTFAVLAVCLIFTKEELNHYEPKEDYEELEQTLKSVLTSIVGLCIIYFWTLAHKEWLGFVSNGMAVIAAILGSVQYFPQILKTWSLKHAGSLSIPMMLVQTPGGFLFAVTLSGSSSSNWSTGLPYYVAATLQGTVLCMCLYFDYVRPKQLEEESRDEIFSDDAEPNENTGLVSDRTQERV